MRQELKIHIKNHEEVESQLTRLGARFSRETNVIDTYFNQPDGHVLKMAQSEDGDILVELKEVDGKFEIIKKTKLKNAKFKMENLNQKYGIKCILKKKRRFFNYKTYILNINLIDNLGEFLIIEGENLNAKEIVQKLKIKNPKFITLSFDQLYYQKANQPSTQA